MRKVDIDHDKRLIDIALTYNLIRIKRAHKEKWYIAKAKHLISRISLLKIAKRVNIMVDLRNMFNEIIPKPPKKIYVYMVRGNNPNIISYGVSA